MANNVTSFNWRFHSHPVLRGNGKVGGYQASVKEATHGFLQILDPQTFGTEKDAVLTAHSLRPDGVFDGQDFKHARMENMEACIDAEIAEIQKAIEEAKVTKAAK